MLNWDEYSKEEVTSPPITSEIKKESFHAHLYVKGNLE